MKKKILALALVVAMLGIALLSGTLAYFTDKEVEDNEFVIGDIDITLKESNGLDETDPDYAENDDDASTTDDAYDQWLADQFLFPGAPIAKNVWVENAGANEAYLRVKITVPQYLVAVWAKDLNAAWTIASTTVNADKSTTYVLEYNTILAKGEKTPICLEAITIDPYTDKQINGADIQTVNVVAEAIQTVGFENNPAAAFAALDAQLTVNEYEGKNYVQAADDTALAAALAGAQPGDVIALVAGVDYGTITLDATNSLEGVAIVGTGANDQIEIVAEAGAVLKDVTIANMDLDFVLDGGSYRGIINIKGGATVENLVIKDSTFVGEGNRSAGVGIFEPTATVTIENCVFEGSKYAVYGSTVPAASLTLKDCAFSGHSSWVVQQNGTAAIGTELTITNCTFDNCKGGIAKYGHSGSPDATFAFTNNTLTDCAGHDGKDSEWFWMKGTATASGNTLDGAAWTPTAAQGFGK